MEDLLNDILRAADKHPNSKVSKLIRTVEEEPSQKNIVLLLIELSDHAEYATDFNISLRYYLDFFERLGIDRDLMLNEAGLLLVNSSKIYSKRVDYVQSLVERQIMTLSNADLEIQQQKEQNQQEATGETATPAEKPKRGRKRVLDAPTDPYEIHLEPKKFKKMTHEKRFALPKTPTKAKPLSRNIEMEQQIHPAVWKYATIYDLENEEDVDTKRNYKLFTYHIEHRYNTLVPDINFRLHFKVKDYMDAQEEEMEDDETLNHTDHTEAWPSLSEEYVKKYISLENRVLQREIDPTIPYVSPKRVKKIPKVTVFNDMDEMDNDETMILEVPVQNLDVTQTETLVTSIQNVDAAGASENTTENLDTTTANDSLSINDSGLGTSMLDSSNNSTMHQNITQNETTANNTTLNNTTITEEEEGKLLETSQTNTENDSALGDSILDQTNISNDVTMELPTSLDTTLGVITTLTVNVCEEQTTNNANAASTSIESTDPTENISNIQEEASKNVSNNLDTNSPDTKETVSMDIANSEFANREQECGCYKDANTSSVEINESETNTPESLNETQHIAVISEKGLGEEKSVANTEDVQKDTSEEGKMNVYQVEIEIENNEGNAESQTIQIQVPNATDDEGVHLSDAYEDDFRLLSPTLKMPNIMPEVERKDVTIYLDEQLREVLALRDDMVEHFSQETYQVPVVEEPKEQPLIFNILKLPPKLFKRKTLFKLGPDMDLFLKARMLKLSRPAAPPKAVRKPKQLQFFPLNNTDMSGIPETPPNSPGHCSDFMGFSDDEVVDDDETTCTEFCGFTEEEQENLLINIHRLSRDSGVGVDVTNLTPEKEHLATIFEENTAPETAKRNLSNELENNCYADARGLTNESTDELLSNLPTSIRNVLEAEMQQCDTELSREVTSSNTENSVEEDSGNAAKTDDNVQKEAQDETNTLTEYDKTAIESSISPNKDTEGQTKADENVEQQTTADISNEQICENNTSKTVSDNENQDTVMEKGTINETQTPNDTINTGCEQENNTTSGDTMHALSKHRESDQEVQQFIDDLITNVCREIQFPDADETKDNHKGINIENEASETNTMQVRKEITSEVAAKYNDRANVGDVDPADDSGSESSNQDDSFFDLDTQGAKTKIQQWHEHLRPILAKSRERHHFDVFQIGTEIIETIQSDEDVEQNNSGIATFGDIMDNKDKSYVSRYFLSTLLLANQSNVSISVENKSSEKPSSWSDIQLKLLSTKRHTVAIEDNIGMISSSNKRKNIQPIEDKVKKKKMKSLIKQISTDDGDSSEDDSEPLMNLQAVIKNTKVSPTKRLQNCDNRNIDVKRNNKGQAINLTHQNLVPTRPEDSQIAKQIHGPHTDISQMLPSTSKQAMLKAQNCEVNLSSIRILQPVEKIPRQGDDLDSGIFSVGEMSVS